MSHNLPEPSGAPNTYDSVGGDDPPDSERVMQRRKFLGFLFGGLGCAAMAGSATAQTVATVLSNGAVPEAPLSDFSSKRGGGGGRGHGGGRGRGRGGGMGRFFGRGRGGCPPGLRKQGRC